MPKNTPGIEEHNRIVDARARSLELALRAWIKRFTEQEFRRLAAQAEGGRWPTTKAAIAKAAGDKELEEALARLIERFGLRQVSDGTARAGIPIKEGDLLRGAVEGKEGKIVTVSRYLDALPLRIRQAFDSSKIAVNENARRVVMRAASERPRPSTSELARRLRVAITGGGFRTPDGKPATGPHGMPLGFRPEPLHFTGSEDSTAYPYWMAARIARTESVQAENTGIVAGIEALGFKEMEWLAITRDRRSGARRHWKMHKKRVKTGELFELPNGTKLRYPGDPLAPIRETINCRCTVRAVRSKK